MNIEILKGNWLENYKYAQELNQIMGADNIRAIKQWEETEKIKVLMNQIEKQ